MAGNQLAPVEFPPPEQHESAPSSADFYFLTSSSKQMASLHEKGIVLRNGLVDPTSLLEYMDGCHCEDLLVGAKAAGSHSEEGHHLLFTDGLIKRQNSRTLTSLRNSKYNIINMLECQEDLFHQLSAEQIPVEEIDLDAAEIFLEEAETLTNLAATSFSISEHGARLESGPLLSRSGRARLEGRRALLAEIYEEDSIRVKNISVMDSSVVTGALLNYLVQRSEPLLSDLVKTRMLAEPIVLSPTIYSGQGLERVADERLKRRINASGWALRRILIGDAQTA